MKSLSCILLKLEKGHGDGKCLSQRWLFTVPIERLRNFINLRIINYENIYKNSQRNVRVHKTKKVISQSYLLMTLIFLLTLNCNFRKMDPIVGFLQYTGFCNSLIINLKTNSKNRISCLCQRFSRRDCFSK